MLTNVQDIIAWGLIVLPLIIIAWAMIWIAESISERNRHERYLRFYQIMQHLGRKDSSQAEKMAAAYELRRYKEYGDIIGRIFIDGRLSEDSSETLYAELRATHKANKSK
jgi:hypothetical protein